MLANPREWSRRPLSRRPAPRTGSGRSRCRRARRPCVRATALRGRGRRARNAPRSRCRCGRNPGATWARRRRRATAATPRTITGTSAASLPPPREAFDRRRAAPLRFEIHGPIRTGPAGGGRERPPSPPWSTLGAGACRRERIAGARAERDGELAELSRHAGRRGGAVERRQRDRRGGGHRICARGHPSARGQHRRRRFPGGAATPRATTAFVDFRETAPAGATPSMFLVDGEYDSRPPPRSPTSRWACPAPWPACTWPGRATGGCPGPGWWSRPSSSRAAASWSRTTSRGRSRRRCRR